MIANPDLEPSGDYVSPFATFPYEFWAYHRTGATYDGPVRVEATESSNGTLATPTACVSGSIQQSLICVLRRATSGPCRGARVLGGARKSPALAGHFIERETGLEPATFSLEG